MTDGYLKKIVDVFYDLDVDALPESVLHQVRRALLDYMGCTSYTVRHKLCSAILDTVESISAKGPSQIWGREGGVCPEAAAFANAARTSNIELDDVSGVGASVHPGVYVWSAAFAMSQKCPTDEKTFLKAVLFGYELCMRMGLLSTQKVRDLGLHGPGLNGAFASLATAGMIAGLSREQMLNAIGIAGSLLPICPFVSFMDGTDSKDYYGGWGCYLGMVAVNAAKNGQTGPDNILNGSKSLIGIYCGDEGQWKLGKDFLIEHISFKEFSACACVHPTASALLKLKAEHPYKVEDVERVDVECYPYAFQLNEGVTEPLNVSSARLYHPYAVSVCMVDDGLRPDAFAKENLDDPRYRALMPKVFVKNHTEYGDGPFSIRGAQVKITLKDGTVLEEEAIGSRWSKGASDEDLIGKYRGLAGSAYTKEKLDEIEEKVWSFNGDPSYFIASLASIGE